MAVGAGDDAIFERIRTELLFEDHALDQALAHIAIFDLTGLRDIDHVGEHFEFGKLVVRRERRMRIRLPLGLDYLHQRLVFLLTCRVAGVHGSAEEGVVREHPTIGDIGIVRDCDAVIAQIAVDLLEGPQVLGVDGVKCGKRGLRAVASPEHIAMHVAAVRDRGPFPSDEGGEFPRLVKAVCRFDVAGPVGPLQFGRNEFGHRDAAYQRTQDLVDRRIRVIGRHIWIAKILPQIRLIQRAIFIDQRRHDTEVFRMIGDADKIVRGRFPDRLTGRRQFDLVAHRIVVSVLPRSPNADHERVR